MHLETWFVWVSRGMNQPFTPINSAYTYNLSKVKLKFLSSKKDQLRAFLDTKSFSETTKFIWDLCETRNFNCTAAEALGVEVTGANFKTSACLFNFTCRIIFAHTRPPHALSFCFKSAEWAGNFVVCSFEVGIEAIVIRSISFRRLCGLLAFNFSRLWVNRKHL